MVARGRKAEQGEATRAALVSVARTLFTKHGFAATATEEVVQRARVTRGALYHHFENKEDLFRAVYEQIESELAERIMVSASRGGNAEEQFRLGLDAFLDACLEPEIQRICLLEAMTVLGWETWHEIDVRYSLGLLQAGLQACIDEGLIEPRPVEPLAHIFLGALIQASMAVARAADPPAARRAVGEEMQRVFGGMLTAPRATRRKVAARR
ncbi:MAG TPA: TetR/AcrR family transcriptional regulator [Acidimicrobiia bacterium]|nr:TetR/AcrR family transcriptional regulator [Acidimicrobiia bacterium]